MPQASSIPAGFHSAMPYLIFDGTKAEAIQRGMGKFEFDGEKRREVCLEGRASKGTKGRFRSNSFWPRIPA